LEYSNAQVVRNLFVAGTWSSPVGVEASGAPWSDRPASRRRAVIDKDSHGPLLARSIGASLLVLLTGVPHISSIRSDGERPLAAVSSSDMGRWLAAGEFAEGSMGPKVRSLAEFLLEGGGREAIVTDGRSLRLRFAPAGTRIHRDSRHEDSLAGEPAGHPW